jgi:UDP-N-acetylmuramoylalanine--D-glutamate ligase
MKIAIIGFGKQGQSSYEYWRDGNSITICDANEDLRLPPDVEAQLGQDYLRDLDKFDLLVRSPLVHPRDLIAAGGPAILEKVTSNTNEFFRVCPTKNIIGVTGTKGKGTTSTLITKLLEASGEQVHLAGNIGTPPLELLKEEIGSDDWVVLELANFQLIDLKYPPNLGVCLMIAPEHLDWHGDMDEYLAAKQQLFIRQKPGDIAIYYDDNEYSKKVASVGDAQKIPYMKTPGAIVQNGIIMIDDIAICRTDELKLLGRHNWQNVCAAVTAVWQITQDVHAIKSCLISFGGLPFRIEFRREVDGIRYYNDSFASGPPASIAAIEAVDGMKVVIMGGYDRGLSLDSLAEDLKRLQSNVRKIVLIGSSAKRTAEVFTEHGYLNFVLSDAKDMPAIVKHATALSSSGDAVILSPAFASFDMFKNFEDRGKKFNEAVENL